MKNAAHPPLEFAVSFDEADGEGIVFFGNYFRLAHRALEQFLPQLGLPWKEWFANEAWGVPLRHVEAEYLQPLRPGDQFQIAIAVADVGESSVQFSYEFVCANGKPAARIKTSHVFVERKTFKKKAIPGDVRFKLQQARE